jgi:hypothetical protein
LSKFNFGYSENKNFDILAKTMQIQVKNWEMHMWNTDPIQIQQYYETWVTLMSGHIREREGKQKKLRR